MSDDESEKWTREMAVAALVSTTRDLQKRVTAAKLVNLFEALHRYDTSTRAKHLRARRASRAQVREALERVNFLAEADAIARALYVSFDAVLGYDRAGRTCKARRQVWLKLRLRGFTMSEIADMFGRDHSTVRHGLLKAAEENLQKAG